MAELGFSFGVVVLATVELECGRGVAQISTWLGFVVDPVGPTVQMARDKQLLVMKLLGDLVSGKVFMHKEIAEGLGRLHGQQPALCRIATSTLSLEGRKVHVLRVSFPP
ncbi:unnamed protein product [Symbiodinium necroappetens]|uniref:Uncharacterized protein n=1 Tax=Symbiodinium necroappetens TaxID=1628268 RepID=A0A813BXD2_9DINO|nr:unnamed protein product [Symbiodinium sp. CCMP2456]CAE7925868.1 unnamed protein product [Symbiodinium necroappetens]